jgi:hypothetical protein
MADERKLDVPVSVLVYRYLKNKSELETVAYLFTTISTYKGHYPLVAFAKNKIDPLAIAKCLNNSVL